MKYRLLILSLFIIFHGYSQTATNFTCADCSGKVYDLFTELDSGKVIVICWVMPCGVCVLPSKTTYNVVQSFSTSHPGKVQMYVCDDFADTKCELIESYAISNGLHNTVRFSNAAISMSHYGTFGMPKVVVVAGKNRKVYFNQNDVINHNQLLQAINSAISETSPAPETNYLSSPMIYPNPVHEGILNLYLPAEPLNSVEIIDLNGKVLKAYQISPEQTTNHVQLDLKGLDAGIYFCRIAGNKGVSVSKLSIKP